MAETAAGPNDVNAPIARLCLALEAHRRTPAGRVRTAEELVAAFFPHDTARSEDRVLHRMPREVRGPIVSGWGIRGPRTALRDDDARVQATVHDALTAGDLDAAGFEQGLSPEVLVRWVALPDLWRFWRGGKLTKVAIGMALVTAFELGLFDAKWFLETLEIGGGRLRGTDALADGLSKADLAAWMQAIHAGGDGSPRGLLAALGWEKVVASSRDPVLIAVLDALAARVGLGPDGGHGQVTGAGAGAGRGEGGGPPGVDAES